MYVRYKSSPIFYPGRKSVFKNVTRFTFGMVSQETNFHFDQLETLKLLGAAYPVNKCIMKFLYLNHWSIILSSVFKFRFAHPLQKDHYYWC